MTWEYEEKLSLPSKAVVKTSDYSSIVTIPDCTRENCGKYSIVAKNAGGTAIMLCRVTVKGTLEITFPYLNISFSYLH